jgi:hypothetical protein
MSAICTSSETLAKYVSTDKSYNELKLMLETLLDKKTPTGLSPEKRQQAIDLALLGLYDIALRNIHHPDHYKNFHFGYNPYKESEQDTRVYNKLMSFREAPKSVSDGAW